MDWKLKVVKCDVKKLQERKYVVSFMHLPAYLEDRNIMDKLEGWGCNPYLDNKEEILHGDTIEDGTRFCTGEVPQGGGVTPV